MNYTFSHIWDGNVDVRAADIESGSDHTYNNVVQPWVLKQLNTFSSSSDSILDIGSGCGFLSNAIYRSGWNNIIGIDISKHSILYSKKKYPHISFIHQNFFEMPESMIFDVCIAIMVVNNMPNADFFFKKANLCLRDNGRIIILLPHPRFWPQKHIDKSSFCYSADAVFCRKFKTKGRKDYKFNVLYYHRSVEQYMYYLNRHGFSVVKIDEIYEKEDDKYPDILGVIAIKK